MPTHRKPKGIYTRSTPDWFVAQLAICGGFFDSPATFGDSAVWAIFNNDTAGRSLLINRLYISQTGASRQLFIGVRQRQLAPVISYAMSIDPSLATPPGIFCAGNIPQNYDQLLDPISYLGYGNQYILFESDSPIYILPPGYELEVIDNSGNVVILSAWYIAVAR